jgi:hypothetical protein
VPLATGDVLVRIVATCPLAAMQSTMKRSRCVRQFGPNKQGAKGSYSVYRLAAALQT